MAKGGKKAKGAKKGKGSKKSKAKRKGKDQEQSDLPELYSGKDTFTFPNGDIYDGEFCAHRIGILWREGHGIYTTKDGQIYEGEWKDDKLVDVVNVKYPSGVQYNGTLEKDKYCGAGTYVLENSLNLSCKFEDNKPTDRLTLIGFDGRLWLGKPQKEGTVLLPENLFYLELTEDRGKGVPKISNPAQSEAEVQELEESASQLNQEYSEETIFAKSLKTRDSLHFEDSPWYQRYQSFIKKRETVLEKLKAEGKDALNDGEKKWLDKYEKFKINRELKKKDKEREMESKEETDVSLLKKFFSKEYKESCPAIRVFYPTIDWFIVDETKPINEDAEKLDEDAVSEQCSLNK